MADSTHLLATGTAYKQVRVYDVRTNSILRRPILHTPEFDSEKLNLFQHRLTSLCQIDSYSIVVGDAAGYIHTLDLRKIHHNAKGRCMAASVGRFSGPAGSVRQIVKHQDSPMIACVGLDRMLRTYHVHNRKQLDCVYLRQRLNCVLFCGDGRWKSPNVDKEEEDESEGLLLGDDDSLGEEDEVKDYIYSDDDDNDDDEDDEDSSQEMSEDYDSRDS
jgi:ribosome biogenesis protein NSA1